jgi:ABC-type multidrug transport system fused ATPase/permease subunit
MRVKTGLITLIYRKSLRLSQGERAGRTSGDIVNLQSVDAVRIGDIAQYGHIAWSGPFQILLSFISLYQLVGWQAFMGVGVMIISLPITTFLSRVQKRLQRRLMAVKDVRTRLMSEILNNIKSIKLYGWERAFANKVYDARNNNELAMLRKIGIVMSCSNFFWATIPFLVAFGTFSTYVATSDVPLTSEMIFPAISLFTLLAFPLSVFSNIINSIIEALVSVERLETFLAADEIDPNTRTITNGDEAQIGDEVVSIKGGEFRWVHDSVTPTLEGIDLSVKKGDLAAIIGRVGDGKSSLLGALLGEMTKSEGTVSLRGDIAYFSQTSWILSATVKDNIVFGHRFDPVFYDKVLDACALRADLAVLPDGHMTEVGEKGVSLSGGQKARICLARAVYARADIYLLDDPLSAVDAHVGRHIFDNVLGPAGLLKSKARILCTNAVNMLPQASQIVMLHKGTVIERSTYAEAMADASSELYKLITGLGKQKDSGGEESGTVTPTIVASEDSDDGKVQDEDGAADADDSGLKRRRYSRRASVLSLRQQKRDAIRDLRESAKPKEHTEKGSVKRDIYKRYLAAASVTGVVVFLVCLILGQAAGIFSTYILRWWGVANSRAGHNVDVAKYLLAYGVMGFSSGALQVLSTVTLRLYCGLRAARIMHDMSFAALMRSPLSFFEVTPAGRVLNLFSRDIFVIDEVLSMALGGFCRTVRGGVLALY